MEVVITFEVRRCPAPAQRSLYQDCKPQEELKFRAARAPESLCKRRVTTMKGN